MDILILSDTHGKRGRVSEVLARTGADILLFLGDGLRDLSDLPDTVTLRTVRGNCDFFGADIPEYRTEDFGNCRIFMTHGHRYGVKGSLQPAILAAAARGADILLYGHTHIPYNQTLPKGTKIGETVLEKPLLVFNPGSLGDPRDGKPTFGTLTLRNGQWLAAHGELK